MRPKASKGLGIRSTQPFKKHQTHYHATSKRSLTLLPNKKWLKLDRNLLPDPRVFYERILIKFRLLSSNHAKALCPFHPDKKPSFSVEFKRGMFFCFSCGEGGGDLIDFYQLMTGADFIKAVNYFEAWKYE